MKHADELRALAAEGATQVEAARRLGISRQRVQAVARDAGISFPRAPAEDLNGARGEPAAPCCSRSRSPAAVMPQRGGEGRCR